MAGKDFEEITEKIEEIEKGEIANKLKAEKPSSQEGETKVKDTWEKTKHVFGYFKPYWKIWVVIFLITIFYTVLSLVNPLIVKFLIDSVLVSGNIGMLKWLIIAFIGLNIMSSGFGILSSWLYARFSERILYDVRNDLYDTLQRLSVGFHHRQRVGDLLTRLKVDVKGIGKLLNLIFNKILMNVLTLAFALVISSALDLTLTLVGMVAIPFALVIQKRYGKKVRKQFRIVRRRVDDLMSFMQSRLSSITTIKLFSQEERESTVIRERGEKVFSARIKTALLRAIANRGAGLVFSLALIAVLGFGSLRVIRGVITIGSLMAVYQYINKIMRPIKALATVNVDFQKTMISVSRIFNFIDQEPDVQEKEDAEDLEEVEGKIEFKDVNFSYKGEEVLKNINFKINPGEEIGLTGPSGCGKTTIINLLFRLYDPDEGTVKIDGRDVKNYTLSSLRGNIGIVPQNPTLMEGSIKDNIAYSEPFAHLEEIKDAAKKAGAHKFIQNLPDGYETQVGEGGANLSGGQRQRVAVARAILSDPELLIMDEPLSQLDLETAEKVREILMKYIEPKTTITISHNPILMDDLDKLLVVKDKTIVEKGTPKELLEKEGVFYERHQTKKQNANRYSES